MSQTLSMKLENGELRINVYDFLERATGEQRASLIDALACQTEVIDEVMNQVLDGWTTMGSYGPKGWGGNPHCKHGIDGARLRIAEASSEVAEKEIQALREAMEKMQARIDEGWAAYRELSESWRYA